MSTPPPPNEEEIFSRAAELPAAEHPNGVSCCALQFS